MLILWGYPTFSVEPEVFTPKTMYFFMCPLLNFGVVSSYTGGKTSGKLLCWSIEASLQMEMNLLCNDSEDCTKPDSASSKAMKIPQSVTIKLKSIPEIY